MCEGIYQPPVAISASVTALKETPLRKSSSAFRIRSTKSGCWAIQSSRSCAPSGQACNSIFFASRATPKF